MKARGHAMFATSGFGGAGRGGHGTGRGHGMGRGRAAGGGRGRNRTGEGGGMGSSGDCICPKCGHKEPHVPGTPCRELRCPECGKVMIREGSYHHDLIEERRRKRDAAKKDTKEE